MYKNIPFALFYQMDYGDMDYEDLESEANSNYLNECM
jgi:hypothetical protein